VDLPFTRALYPPGGERLGKNPTGSPLLLPPATNKAFVLIRAKHYSLYRRPKQGSYMKCDVHGILIMQFPSTLHDSVASLTVVHTSIFSCISYFVLAGSVFNSRSFKLHFQQILKHD
jgi:hypothetical protein